MAGKSILQDFRNNWIYKFFGLKLLPDQDIVNRERNNRISPAFPEEIDANIV